MAASATLASLCLKCGEKLLDGGGTEQSSIKTPILCCVTTRELHLDLHDSSEDDEEKRNTRLDKKKEVGRKGDGGAKPTQHI